MRNNLNILATFNIIILIAPDNVSGKMSILMILDLLHQNFRFLLSMAWQLCAKSKRDAEESTHITSGHEKRSWYLLQHILPPAPYRSLRLQVLLLWLRMMFVIWNHSFSNYKLYICCLGQWQVSISKTMKE